MNSASCITASLPTKRLDGVAGRGASSLTCWFIQGEVGEFDAGFQLKEEAGGPRLASVWIWRVRREVFFRWGERFCQHSNGWSALDAARACGD